MERFAPLQIFIQELIETWNDVKPTRMAAALAYYGMFSFVPVVYVTLRVAGIFISDVILSEQIYERMTHTFGAQTAEFIQDMVLATENVTSGGSTLATLVTQHSPGEWLGCSRPLDKTWVKPRSMWTKRGT